MIPEVMREIGGVNYTLRFSARTTIAIEQEFQCKIGALPKLIGGTPDATTTARLTRLCMRRDGKMLTEAEFDEVLDQISIEDLATILNEAMSAATPEKPTGDGGN